MAREIHAKKTEGRGLLFRVWSTTIDGYVTEEMSEEEVCVFLRQEALDAAARQFDAEIGSRIQRAVSSGTSSLVTTPRDLSDWETPRSDCSDDE